MLVGAVSVVGPGDVVEHDEAQQVAAGLLVAPHGRQQRRPAARRGRWWAAPSELQDARCRSAAASESRPAMRDSSAANTMPTEIAAPWRHW